jgi:hypothetical protein
VRRILLIVARGDPLMYATLKQSFAGYAGIDVILDRRLVPRRRLVLPTEVDRRLRERRSFNIDALLRQLGWSWSREPTSVSWATVPGSVQPRRPEQVQLGILGATQRLKLEYFVACSVAWGHPLDATGFRVQPHLRANTRPDTPQDWRIPTMKSLNSRMAVMVWVMSHAR